MKKIEYTAVQKRIIDEPSSNMLISAGAGSGKTFVLTQRVINLLKNKNYKLKEMIILTFTDLAASEMKSRIIDELSKENKQELEDELKHIDEASIQTFDSFCRAFISKYSCYSRIPKKFEIGDTAMFKMVIFNILKDVLEPYFKSPVPAFDELLNIFNFSRETAIYEYFYTIYSKIQNVIDEESFIKNYIQYFYSTEFLNSIITKYIILAKEKASFIINIVVPDYSPKITEYVNGIKESLSIIMNADSLQSIIDELKKYQNIVSPKNTIKDESIKDEFKAIYD